MGQLLDKTTRAHIKRSHLRPVIIHSMLRYDSCVRWLHTILLSATRMTLLYFFSRNIVSP